MIQGHLKELAKSNRPLNQKKVDKRLEALDGLIWFYEDKLANPELEDRFKEKFRQFKAALHYSKTMIIKYQGIAKTLQELEEADETRLNS